MHGMILARVAGIEEFGILVVVVVRHSGGMCGAPAVERRSEKVAGGPIDRVGVERKREKL